MEQQNGGRVAERTIIIIAIVLAAAGAAYYHYWHTAPVAERKEIVTTLPPDRFPANLPVPGDAGITDNYITSGPGVPFQATRAYTTRTALDEVYNQYRAFFGENGWAMVGGEDAATYRYIIAEQGTLNLQASAFFTDNAAANERTVNVTITTLRKTMPPSPSR